MALQMRRRRNTSSDDDIPMAPMIELCVFVTHFFHGFCHHAGTPAF